MKRSTRLVVLVLGTGPGLAGVTAVQAQVTTAATEAAAASAPVKGDAAAGAAKVAVCAACHGEGGHAPIAPIYPSIGGQSVEYLTSSLLAYRDGQRQGGMSAMMSPQVAAFSDQDVADVAAYYATQERGAAPKQPAAGAAGKTPTQARQR